MSSDIKTAKGFIYSFRRKVDTQHSRVIITIPGVDDVKTLYKFVGKKVIWRNRRGKVFVGFVRRVWGKRGNLLVVFRKNLPGYALGTEVEVIL